MLKVIGGWKPKNQYGLVLKGSEDPKVSHAFILHESDEDAPFLSTNLARGDVIILRDFLNELLNE